jgi:hypothetical protein
MFGMSQQPTTNANVDTLSNSENVIPFEDNRVNEFLIGFAPMKLRFAMLLADLGYVSQSLEYCNQIKHFISSLESGILIIF